MIRPKASGDVVDRADMTKGGGALTPPSAPEAFCAPILIAASGPEAVRAYWEFLTVPIRNRNTRRAYRQAAADLSIFLREQGVEMLIEVKSWHVAGYVEQFGKTHAPATAKARLAAIRSLLDWLVVRQVIPSNPAAAVRGPKHVVRRGRTPVLARGEAQSLIRHLDVATVVGRRDRALIGVMLYGLVRVSAAVGMRVEDFEVRGSRRWLVLREKGGRTHEIPAHHALDEWMLDYIDAAGIAHDAQGPLFRSSVGRSGTLSDRPLAARNALHMVRRRCRDAGIETPIGCHSLRATGITAYLGNGGMLEIAQRMAGHASPRTTQLYGRTGNAITFDEVERIIL
jgi:site-specific recombinase XerD